MPDTPQPAPKDPAVDPGPAVESPGVPEVGRAPNNLPLELSSFVGREREVEVLLSGNRLVTLTGPGGSGKTRLALRVASEALEASDDGAWLVELAPLSDPDLVARTVATVLGVREAPGGSLLEALSEHLRPRRLLLVLDNSEHLGACRGGGVVLCRESVDLFREAGDETNLALTLMGASVTWLQPGDAERAGAHLGIVYLK